MVAASGIQAAVIENGVDSACKQDGIFGVHAESFCHAGEKDVSLRQAAGVPSPGMLLLLRQCCVLSPQQQRERYPWRWFGRIPGRILSIAWGQGNYREKRR